MSHGHADHGHASGGQTAFQDACASLFDKVRAATDSELAAAEVALLKQLGASSELLEELDQLAPRIFRPWALRSITRAAAGFAAKSASVGDFTAAAQAFLKGEPAALAGGLDAHHLDGYAAGGGHH